VSGDYETAVFKAFKTLEDLVRRRAGLSNQSIGVPLMREAFDKKDGRLTDKSEHEGERDALAHVRAGAIGRFKNPTSHRFTGLDDPIVTGVHYVVRNTSPERSVCSLLNVQSARESPHRPAKYFGSSGSRVGKLEAQT
jgi:uncharacterized protein (TIGR02391 family)